MKKIKFILPFLLPVIISICVFFTFYKEPSPQNSNELAQEEVENNRKIMDDWIENKKNFMTSDFYEKVKVKKGNEVFELKNLEIKKREVFKLTLLSKTKRDFDLALKNKDKLQSDQYEEIKKLYQDINKKIDDQKKLLYNLYGAGLIPLDKLFLEQFDVYFFDQKQ